MSRIELPGIENLITAQLDSIEEPVDALLSAKGKILQELRPHPGLSGIIKRCIESVPGIAQASQDVRTMMREEIQFFTLAGKSPNNATAEFQRIDDTHTGWYLSMPETHLSPRDQATRTAEIRRLLEGGNSDQWTLDIGEFDRKERWALLERGMHVGSGKVFYDSKTAQRSYQALRDGTWYLGKSLKINRQRNLPEDDYGSARLVNEKDWHITGPLYSYGIRYDTRTGEISIVRGLNAEGFDF